MTGQGKNRQFPTAFKLKAIKRVERGDGVLPVARELGISRKILHDWIKVEGAWTRGIKPQTWAQAWPSEAQADSVIRRQALRARAGEGPHRRARTGGGSSADGPRFFSASLARIGAAGNARQTRTRIIEVIKAMTVETTDSHADVQRLCRLEGLPRATYYRHLARHDRKAANCELRDLIQRISASASNTCSMAIGG